MKQTLQFTNDAHYLALFLLLVASMSLVANFMFFIRLSETKVAKATCASFSSYAEALQAYNAGNRSLDHNRNGFPCQLLLK